MLMMPRINSQFTILAFLKVMPQSKIVTFYNFR